MLSFPQITRFGMDFSPSKSSKVFKNQFRKILSLYTAYHYFTRNGPILFWMLIFLQKGGLVWISVLQNCRKSQNSILNNFITLNSWSIFDPKWTYFGLNVNPSTRFGMDSSPSKSPKDLKNQFWTITISLHSWSLFNPTWSNISLD
jgi:hypothetical protein